MTVGADDDEARCVVLSGSDNPLPGGRSLDRRRLRPESGCLGQCGSVLRSLLGGLPDVVCACCIELRAGLRNETHVERSPHGDY